ncbi:MAG TPA: response regulator [Burkholderiaceae bacterium]|jgi:FixJ family two-component response regulator|nr:response regulator [Burkholderiaceae bacterium]
MSTSIPTAEVAAPGRVLLIDDEPNVLKALGRSLRGCGFGVATAAGGDEALALLHRESVDAIVCDMRMPGMSGTEVLKRSLRVAPDAVRVLLTGHADIGSAISAINEGEVFRYLTKPWDDLLLLQVLHDGLARKARERERDALMILTEQRNEQLRRRNAGLGEEVAQRTIELECAVAELRNLSGGRKADFSPAGACFAAHGAEHAPEDVLTERQIEILTLIARGFAAKEAAFKLGLSPKTVDVHRARIMERLGIDDVAGLTLYCVRHALVDPRLDGRRGGSG